MKCFRELKIYEKGVRNLLPNKDCKLEVGEGAFSHSDLSGRDQKVLSRLEWQGYRKVIVECFPNHCEVNEGKEGENETIQQASFSIAAPRLTHGSFTSFF